MLHNYCVKDRLGKPKTRRPGPHWPRIPKSAGKQVKYRFFTTFGCLTFDSYKKLTKLYKKSVKRLENRLEDEPKWNQKPLPCWNGLVKLGANEIEDWDSVPTSWRNWLVVLFFSNLDQFGNFSSSISLQGLPDNTLQKWPNCSTFCQIPSWGSRTAVASTHGLV